MSKSASWWSNPGSNDGSVKAHTPDETKYHYTDDRQNERMRGGITGVVIPRANADGTSKGFDSDQAGVVHVDPDAPDGGAVVDLTHLSKQQYYAAFAQAQYPHEVFYKLGSAPEDLIVPKQPQPSRSNHIAPAGTYIVPSASQDGVQQYVPQYQEQIPMQAVPPLPQAVPAMAPQPQPQPEVSMNQPMPQPSQGVPTVQAPQAYQPPQVPQPPFPPQAYPQAYQQPQQYQPVPPLPPSPETVQLQQQMAQVVQMIGGLTQQIQQQRQPVAPLPPPPPKLRMMPEDNRRTPQEVNTYQAKPIPRKQFTEEEQEEFEPTQTLSQIQAVAQTEERRDGLVVGFETLQMPFVNGPLPTKAKKRAWITIPGGGTYEARYHEISIGKECLALVYDTRYEDGQQYVPPDLGDKLLEVRLPGGKGKEDKVYTCSSMGFHFSIGVLEIVVLVRHEDEVPQAEEDEDEDYETEEQPPARMPRRSSR